VTNETSEPILSDAASRAGDADAIRLLAELVALAPTNLEDPLRHRWEKPHYQAVADRIVRSARLFGLATRTFDPLVELPAGSDLHGVSRPNVIVDLDVGAERWTLLLAHYDVVPVPEEQLTRWHSPPHTLTARADGRLYGRGSNDDLGSGIVASLIAMKHLAQASSLPSNVRLLACCDEETGGAGGIEALKEHDAELGAKSPDRLLLGDVALIPDGSPHATAGSSGVAFLDGTFSTPVPIPEAVAFGKALIDLHELARTWRSIYPSPDWPDHQAPDPRITGRASLTRMDYVAGSPGPTGSSEVHLISAHAETEASNQIPEAVSLVFGGPLERLEGLEADLRARTPAPFRLSLGGRSSLPTPPGGLLLQVVGVGAHGGYPHLAHNPVPATLALLAEAAKDQLVSSSGLVLASYGVDLRFIPEMDLAEGLAAALGNIDAWIHKQNSSATVTAPEDRCRGGYALPIDHPAVRKLERLLREEFGASGVFGEYGGTDASSLATVRTPSGAPLPALVFGSMDRLANIHQAEESVDPSGLGSVIRTIERFILEP
jgi:acetylornithine deacetylase/succinyl-diaminopimelate desuccinylase-like protein